jgi:hypothetical protein
MEGEHDLTFLRLLSQQLHAEDASLPDLSAWEQKGKAVLLSIGGGNPASWATRLAPLGLPEVHILCGAQHKMCYVAHEVMWRPVDSL